MNWNVSYSEEGKKEWIELKTAIPVPRDAAIRDIYFMLLRRKVIKRFPRKVKKNLYYMGSKGRLCNRSLKYLCKYLLIEEKEEGDNGND